MLGNPVVNIRHKVVEMGAPFCACGDELEEHVHQHGLAAPNLAMNVEAGDLVAGLLSLSKQPAKRARLPRHALFLDAIDQEVEFANDLLLRRIACDCACFHKVRVSLRNSKMRGKAVTHVHWQILSRWRLTWHRAGSRAMRRLPALFH